uniref:Uncharacterized protein n=1 Tax=Spongospora subterranea TaxID=70186 RepID=A0A0H5RDM5_9EUKA|eukprot:CRZ11667.1 hypothetical protein [Spongospora subterranea]
MTDFLGIALVLIIPFGYAGTTCGRSHGHNPESGSDPQWHVYLTAIVSSMLVPFVSFLGMLAVKFFRVNAKTSLPIQKLLKCHIRNQAYILNQAIHMVLT